MGTTTFRGPAGRQEGEGFIHKTADLYPNCRSTHNKKATHRVISISTSAITLQSVQEDCYYTSDSYAATYCPSAVTALIAGQATETSRVIAAVATTKCNNGASV